MSIDIRSRDFLGKNKMRYVFGLSTGNGLNNPQFTDFSMVYLARLEYLPLGIFRDYSEVDFARTKPRLSIGATYSFFQGADRVRGMVGDDFADGGTANYHFVLRRTRCSKPEASRRLPSSLFGRLPQEDRRQHRAAWLATTIPVHPR